MAQFSLIMYELTYAKEAEEDLARLKKNEPVCFKKALKLLKEIAFHPTTGTGHPEQLKSEPENTWSRHISKKHRLVYRIFGTEVYIYVLSAYGHYDDK